MSEEGAMSVLADDLRYLQERGVIASAWLPGMLGEWSDSRGSVYRPRVEFGGYPGPWAARRDARIVTDDPATTGCLAALAREAWGDPTLSAECWAVLGAQEWTVTGCDGHQHSREATEPAAWAAALHARAEQERVP